MMMGGGLLVGLVLLLLILVLLGGGIAAVVWLTQQGPRRPAERSGELTEEGDRALEILRRRYARGEIDREEFLQMRDEIRD